LLKLKYHNAIADAVADFGRPEEIGQCFAGFQKYLYQDVRSSRHQNLGA
jgi:type I restriction enzyme, R subunit